LETRPKLLASFGWLTLGRTAGDAFLFAMFVVLSTTFGPEGIGRYSFAMALTGLFAAAADFGLYPFSLVEFSRDRRFGLLCGRILLLRLPLLLLTWSALAAAALLGALPEQTVPVVLIVGAYQLFMTWVDGVNAAFVARGDPGLAARTELSLKAVAAGLAISLALSGASLVAVVAVLPAVAALAGAVALGLAASRYGIPELRGAWAGAREIAGRALPFAESQVLAQVCTRIDVVLLGFLLGVEAAGVYNVGFRVVFLLLFIPQFAAVSFTPHATRLHQQRDPEAFAAFLRDSLGGVLLVAAPATAGLWLVGPELLGLAFGPDFADSGRILRILAAVLGLSFASRTLGNFLMAAGREHARNRAYRAATGVSVAANAALIPTLGIEGAAVAAVATEVALSWLFLLALRPGLGWPRVGSRLGIALLGSAVFFVPFAFLWPGLSAPVVVPASLALYAGVLACFPATRRSELRALLRAAGLARGG
jgi:O-antigen/teichoic acid export membrane protein